MLTASQVKPRPHTGLSPSIPASGHTFAVSLGLPHSKNSHSKSNHSGRMDKEKTDWKIEKERLLSLNLEERRKEYRRQEFTPLGDISTWRQECKENAKVEENEPTGGSSTSDKVSLHKGDITVLEVDAIVNAANSSLLGGGGVDGCIHKAAGGCLYDECHSLNGCETGKAKITCGYDLPAKYVIHTVGPVARGRAGPSESSDLSSCYQNSLKLLVENNLTTVAFPCISTGIFGFPNKSAADIALKTVKSWIEENPNKITRVIFCVFLDTDYDIYKEKMAELFQENDMEVTEEQLKAGNTPPSKKSKNREPSEDRNTDAVTDNDIHMESQNLDEMVDDEKPSEEAREEEDDDGDGDDDGEESNPKEKAEEEQPAAKPMEGDPGKPIEEMDDNAEEDGERGASNGVDVSAEAEENKD